MKSLPKKSLLIPILFLVVFLVATTSIYSYYLSSARNSAVAAIESSEIVIKRATLATIPGSEEASALNSSALRLNDVKTYFESASFFDRSKYVEAKIAADEADDFAQSVVDKFEREYDVALEALFHLNFEPAFSFYKNYPRTEEAISALTAAELAMYTRIKLLSSGTPELPQRTLEQVSQFNSAYPKSEKSQSVLEATGNLLVDVGFKNITLLEPMVEKNRESLQKISTTHETQRFRSVSDRIVTTTGTISNLMPNFFMPPEMNQLFVLLVESNELSKEFQATMNDGSGINYDEVVSLTEMNEELGSKINEAKAVLATLKTTYPGSSESQAGFAAGVEARSD